MASDQNQLNYWFGAAAPEMRVTMAGGGPGRIPAEQMLENIRSPVAANRNVSQQQIKEMVGQPLSQFDRDWQNYISKMSPDEVMGSDPVWAAANRAAEQGVGRAKGFADAANSFWQRMGANRYISEEQARRYMAIEEAKMRGIGTVK